jgi:type IV pilus assembly protein PilZ
MANREALPRAAACRSERRKSPRADVVVRVSYQTVDELFSEFARNINEGGLFVETERPHPIGTSISLQFQIPGSDEPIKVEGAVVRISDGTAAEPPGMGIEFEDLDRAARHHINELVRKLRSDPLGA